MLETCVKLLVSGYLIGWVITFVVVVRSHYRAVRYSTIYRRQVSANHFASFIIGFVMSSIIATVWFVVAVGWVIREYLNNRKLL